MSEAPVPQRFITRHNLRAHLAALRRPAESQAPCASGCGRVVACCVSTLRATRRAAGALPACHRARFKQIHVELRRGRTGVGFRCCALRARCCATGAPRLAGARGLRTGRQEGRGFATLGTLGFYWESEMGAFLMAGPVRHRGRRGAMCRCAGRTSRYPFRCPIPSDAQEKISPWLQSFYRVQAQLLRLTLRRAHARGLTPKACLSAAKSD
jgi:hypothetical protein